MNENGKKTKILFLCTGNACRSQMAEGWARELKSESIEAYSAGINPIGVSSRAVETMADAGVDISGHRSKHLSEFINDEFDYVITLCGHADKYCPSFPGNTRKVHVPFDDPYSVRGSREYVMSEFRRVRDEIKAFVETLPESLEK